MGEAKVDADGGETLCDTSVRGMGQYSVGLCNTDTVAYGANEQGSWASGNVDDSGGGG